MQAKLCDLQPLLCDNNHEEADTLVIHHAVLSSRRNPAKARIVTFSPDTDVLVLAVANHHLLLRNISVSMVSGVIDVEPIVRALDRQRANALRALHAFSGADTVGKFNQLGNAMWLKLFMTSGSDTISALEQFSLSLPLFPFVRGEVMPATFSLPHLLVFSTLLCLVSSSSSSLPPLLPSSHLSFYTVLPSQNWPPSSPPALLS